MAWGKPLGEFCSDVCGGWKKRAEVIEKSLRKTAASRSMCLARPNA
eukprot:CAMPEP_0197889472 /NCGR_PEP_ID=MMETSP1439-20131203/24361_1 /TAXON_ID=66791 /ORGANISM="Gonyaulax spinifera, Strain CCMP409" /LENGTH=45 /DNA_ID= /DNA_START= /DNA_END= /DNA_ORIENTATION=